ncbi:MAG: beta-glucuronidase, partial [Blautia sp.]|nr:beta-glucuronidase [Blautia sp.]
MEKSLLYPVSNPFRSRISLDGLWKFQFDPYQKGMTENWKDGLKNPLQMPVPASFADLFTTEEERDYCGDFW